MSPAAVSMRGVSYAYPDGVTALRDVSLEVGRGETVGIVGPNGAGKSTLLLHLNGLLRGTGTVRVAGIEVDGKSLREVRRLVGLVFQDPEDQLFTPTVYDDVAFGPLNLRLPPAEVDARVGRALSLVGMAGFEARSAHHLSYGEKKRVALATVLSCGPEIIALDEPTSNLDPAGREEFIRALASLPGTKLVATHDLELVLEACGRAVVLYGGRVVADGPPPAVLGDRELMERHGLRVPFSLRPRRG